MPEPVRPMSGTRPHATPLARDEPVKWSASIATYPPLSTNTGNADSRGSRGLDTTAHTVTLVPAPLTVIGTRVVPRGARAQSTLNVARTWSVTVPPRAETRSHGA